MRLRLVGYSGVRPPVPGTATVDPEDPEPTPDPVPDDIPQPLVLTLANGDEFRKADYLALGYNRFDVMCIGAAGGRGGQIKQFIPDSGAHKQVPPTDYDLYWDSYRYIFGGAGGGGGVHRVKGRLALLPTITPVVVGQPGANGAYSEVHSPFHDWRTGSGGYAPAPAPPPGGDGGASSFGGTICRASGGKGGTDLGGAGGIGNADGAGGGPIFSWNQSVTTDPSTGEHTLAGINPGKWDGKIGSGGAGGRGSIVKALEGTFASGGSQMGQDPNGGHNGYSSAGDGAPGAYSPTDSSISGPGELGSGFGLDYFRIVEEFETGYNRITPAHYDVQVAIPGAGGGATTFPITGELYQYGSKKGHPLWTGGAEPRVLDLNTNPGGRVVIRLTYAIV